VKISVLAFSEFKKKKRISGPDKTKISDAHLWQDLSYPEHYKPQIFSLWSTGTGIPVTRICNTVLYNSVIACYAGTVPYL
jgi:hypothetical protein